VGIILPFSSTSPSTRALATAMMRAAELALFDANNRDILLITADDTGTPQDATDAAQKLLAQGAEIIVGPLFSQSVAAVAPLARDRGVPLIAFSTDASVAGNGVYLLSFMPQNEVKRVIGYAASQGRSAFGALIPQTAYGDVVAKAFSDSVAAANKRVVDVERFSPSAGAIVDPAAAIAKAQPDAVLIAQGGTLLRGIAPALEFDGLDHTKVKFLGTGLWDDPSIGREPLLEGGWFAAPDPDMDAAFVAKYRSAFGAPPPQLAALSFDAITLVAALAGGQPYHRFTQAALNDPNGFAGVDGIFRFAPDGTIERGLAVLGVAPGGVFEIVDPAPRTFEKLPS
jgi:ABC-type branched-subunit amino acid transport system substrate-binding protein